MGAAESGPLGPEVRSGMLLENGLPFCCGTGTASLDCCERSGGMKNDIIRAPPMQYPEPSTKASDGLVWQLVGGGNGNAANGDNNKGMAAAVAGSTNGGGCSGLSAIEAEETYEDGSMYTGQIAAGKRHGRGVWTSASEEYTGQWKDDQRDGQGKQTWHDGRVYEGQFKAGKFHGQGRMEWHMPTGLMVYEGQYVDDLKDGFGRYVWPDKRVYDGEWKKGMREGRATFTNSCGQSRQSVWRENKVEKWLEEEPRASGVPKRGSV